MKLAALIALRALDAATINAGAQDRRPATENDDSGAIVNRLREEGRTANTALDAFAHPPEACDGLVDVSDLGCALMLIPHLKAAVRWAALDPASRSPAAVS